MEISAQDKIGVAVSVGAAAHRRKLSLCLLAHWEMKRRIRSQNISYGRFDFDVISSVLTERMFLRIFRIQRDSFHRLIFILAEHHASFVSGKISPAAKLSMTLRFLGGGSYIDIAWAHRVAHSTFYACVWETVSAILDSPEVGSIHFPCSDEDGQYLREQSLVFSRGISPISGCIAALDGIAIKIAEPSSSDVSNAATYYNRKGFHSICVQALCNAEYRFVGISALCPGSTHDSTAWNMTRLSQMLEAEHPRALCNKWIAADEAYPAREYLITPVSGRSLGKAEQCFNYWQSSARIFIEQTFGIWTRRWGIFWRPIRVSMRKIPTVILCCARLHNFVIDESKRRGTWIQAPTLYDIDARSHSEVADGAIILQDEVDLNGRAHRRRRDLEVSSLRQDFIEKIREMGIGRP
jgi:nuclease HARBI1